MQTLKEFLTHNWFAKLFSLALATMLWITMSSESTSEIGLTIPLEYRNIPSQMEVTGDASTVEVRLRGSANVVREVSPRDVSATVDLSSWVSGERVVQLTPQIVRSPFGVEVVRVAPSRVKLMLERTISKRLPIEAKIEGRPAAGFEIQDTTVEPKTVEVQGPESKVQKLESVPTMAVLVNGRNHSFTQTIDLDLGEPTVRLQYVLPVEVRVNLRETRK